MPNRASTVSIAIASDLHCHGPDEHPIRESLLIVGEPRIPADRHPGAALLELARREELQADVLLCPGDLANKVSSMGMAEAYRELRDAAQALGGASLVATLGNHDVASREEQGDPFGPAKHFHGDFPTPESSSRNSFWANGFFLCNLNADCDVVVLNTAHHHYSKPEAKRGTFPEDSIEALDEHLSGKAKPPLRVALLHHHPIVHSFGPESSEDVVPTGDQLLETLGRHNTSVVIHGHRHQPRLSRYEAAGTEMLVLAAGSFSASLREWGTTTRNLFHLLELTVPAPVPTGTLYTWEFRYSEGWSPATKSSAQVPHVINIARQPPPGFYEQVKEWAARELGSWTGVDELADLFPEVTHLLPQEVDRLFRELAELPDVRIIKDEFGDLQALGRIGR